MPLARTHTPYPIQGAKEDSDAFLTGLINQELAQKSDDRGAEQDKTQRPESEPKGAAAVAGGGSGQRDTSEPEPMELELCGARGSTTAPPVQGGAVVGCFHRCRFMFSSDYILAHGMLAERLLEPVEVAECCDFVTASVKMLGTW